MIWGAPELLYLLLLLPLVVMFSLWRLRPRPVTVGSLQLWQDFVERPAPIRRLQRPRFTLLVLLQVMALSALVLALAHPQPTRDVPEPLRWSIAIDVSDSMFLHGESGSRLEEAKTAAIKILDELPESDLVRLVIGSGVSREMSPGDARQELFARGARGESVVQPLALLRSLHDNRATFDRFIWMSDHEPRGDVEDIALILVGERLDNAAIVSVDDAGLAEGGKLGVCVVATAAVQRELLLERISGSGAVEVVSRFSLTIPERTPKWASVDVSRDLVGSPLRARLSPADRNPKDDAYPLVVSAVRPVPVEWVGDAHPELVAALQAAGLVDIRMVQGLSNTVNTVILGDDVDSVPSLQMRPVVVAGPDIVVEGLGQGRPVVVTAPLRWNDQHPWTSVVRDLDPPNLREVRPLTWNGPGDAVPLLTDAMGRELILAVEFPSGGSLVAFGFDTRWGIRTGTAWSSEPSYPIFWANWLRLAVGVADRDGQSLRISDRPPADAELLVGDSTSGLYRLEDGGYSAIVRPREMQELLQSGMRRPWSPDDGQSRKIVKRAQSTRMYWVVLAIGLLMATWWIEYRAEA